MQERSAGILLHTTSLPGGFGIGELGSEAVAFLDWLRAAGQSVWQILPLGPTGPGNSPYTATSAFAGNPLLISPTGLLEAGLLPRETLADPPAFSDQRVDYGPVGAWKSDLLRTSWRQFRSRTPQPTEQELEEFSARPENRFWLDDWALYSALKGRFAGVAWNRWPEEVRRREPDALRSARRQLAEEVEFQRYQQFLFDRQWSSLKAEAARRGIRLLGDLPMYVAEDSVDVWAHQELFHLDPRGRPITVAGVPPDAFSPTGQRWGNPIYRWDRLRATGYAWWIERLRAALRRTDLLRLDHFRGFAGYWEIPASAETAEAGRWRQGPGAELFRAISDALGPLPLIAEDLGRITPDVEDLRTDLALPGMRVLQFGFASPDSEHHPDRITEDTVVYTGTHDNDTARGWFQAAGQEERRRVLETLASDGSQVPWDLIRAAFSTPARLAIVPLQDVLGLGSEARMNRPGEPQGSWEWRVEKRQLSAAPAARLAELTEHCGRWALPTRPAAGLDQSNHVR